MLLVKVLNDWLSEVQGDRDAAATKPAIVDQAERSAMEVHNFLKEQVKISEAKNLKVRRAAGIGRQPNQDFVVQLDLSYKAVGWRGLVAWQCNYPIGPLKASEQRYFQPRREEEDEDEPSRRSCILNTETNDTRFELPRTYKDDERQCPSLWLAMDWGMIGKPASFWMYTLKRIRGFAVGDPWHAEACDLQFAWTESGTYTLKLEYSVFLNMTTGSKNAHFFRLRGCAHEFVETHDETNDVFRFLYTDIARAFRMHLDIDFGGPDHYRKVWDRCKQCPFLFKAMSKMRLGRWYQHENKAVVLFEWIPCILMYLIWFGIRKGWWQNIVQTPLYHRNHFQALLDDDPGAVVPADVLAEDVVEAAAAPPVVEGAEVVAQKSVKESNDELQKTWKSVKGTLHFAAVVLARLKNINLWKCNVLLSMPLVHQHAKDVPASQSPALAKTMIINQSLDGFAQSVLDIFAVLQDYDFLVEIGMDPEMDEHEGDAETNAFVLSHCLRFVCHLGYARLLSGYELCKHPPFQFLQLFHPAVDRPEKLKQFSDAFELLTSMEEKALTCKRTDKFLFDLVWPSAVWVREQFVRLLEDGFERVPSEFSEECDMLSDKSFTTRPVELMFKEHRHTESIVSGGQLGSRTIWHQEQLSTVLADHGRPKLPITSAARSASAGAVPKSCFENSNWSEFSLGIDSLSSLADDRKFPSPTRASYKELSLAWLSALHFDGDMDKISLGWMATLLDPGILVRGPDGTGGAYIT